MSNVVHHYLDVSQELAEFLQKNRLKLSQMLIDMKQIRQSANQIHVQFDTRGSDYPLDLVKEVLTQFPQTSWTAMEENCIRQAMFSMQNQEVSIFHREIVEAVGDCVMKYQIETEDYRPQQAIFLFSSGILQLENFIGNNAIETKLTPEELEEFYAQIEWMKEFKEKGGACVDTVLPNGNSIYAPFVHFKSFICFDSPGYSVEEVDAVASQNFTLFTSYLKQIINKKQIRNLL